jgi:3-hydroxyacyl-CoA dehydrogenase
MSLHEAFTKAAGCARLLDVMGVKVVSSGFQGFTASFEIEPPPRNLLDRLNAESVGVESGSRIYQTRLHGCIIEWRE